MWITKHDVYTLKQNFISRETFMDIQLSCHFVVLLIKIFRDRYSHLAVPLSSTGSDACENFFSKVGGMVSNERCYDGCDLLSSAGALNRISEFQAGSNLSFPAAHSKQENIWVDMNHMPGIPLANLNNYTVVSTDEQIVYALKEGLAEAKVMCRELGMEGEASWGASWEEKDILEHLENNAHDNLEEEEVSLDDFVGDVIMDTVLDVDEEDTIAQSELRHVMDSIVDNEENVVSQISPFVEVDGKTLCKSTLVSQLNGNPMLSKDRLTRVKSGVYFSFEMKSKPQTSTCIGIGYDCAVLFEDIILRDNTKLKRKGKVANTSQGVKKGIWYLGRVMSMRMKLGNGMKETRGPFDLLDRPPNVEIHLAWYQKTKGSRCYTYDLVDNQSVSLESIIALANLSYDPISKKYQLDPNDYKIFNDYVKDT